MDEIKAKQQIVEKIKEASKILVTVSDSPSVDALSAALGLTLLLDKKEKYATAIFSGETPPAIAFLEPEKTFDDTTDSLRDFIIALNKEKADHLRYKVEGDSVKIFITPYKTTIDQTDLEFSQGDYNVELVIALGVDNQDHLDAALENHGQILHDAAIITITAGDQSSDLGGIDWHDANASSLSEMVSGLAEALKDDKKKSLLDEPIATALLTGIVAETDRFSNEHTTSKVMTVAASLMAAGADQQLIANELQATNSIEVSQQAAPSGASDVEVDTDSADGSLTIHKEKDGISINHDGETLAELDRRVLGNEKAKEKVLDEVEAVQEAAAQEEAKQEAEAALQKAQQSSSSFVAREDRPLNEVSAAPAAGTAYAAESDAIEPALGGTLNATTEQAADDARREAESDQNRTILSHSYIGSDDAAGPATGSVLQGTGPIGFPGTPDVAPGSQGVNDADDASLHSAYALDDQPGDAPGLQPIGAPMSGERVIQPPSDMFAPAAPAPAPGPVDLGLPLPPPIPDFSQGLPPQPAIPLSAQGIQPEILGDILAPEPSNAIPAPNTAYAFEPEPPVATPQPNDPAQFQIPPQQQ